MTIKKVILTISLIFSLLIHSQNEIRKDEKFKLNPWDNINGYRYSIGQYSNTELEVSYLLTSYPSSEPGFGAMIMRVQYVGLGLEYLKIGNKNAFGAKLSYENSFFLFSGQISSDILFTNNSTQFRLMPKIGLSIFGFVTLYYGWNHDLLKNSDLKTEAQTISIQLNYLEF